MEGAGGPKPPKPRWGTRLGLLAGAMGLACMLGSGCERRIEDSAGQDSCAGQYNSGMEMGENLGRTRALLGRIAKDRRRICKIKERLRGEENDGEIHRLRGMISSIRDGINEMYEEIEMRGGQARERGKVEQAKGEALLERPGEEI